MLDLTQPRLWSLGDFAKAIAALSNADRQKWLTVPALLLASDSEDGGGQSQFTTIGTDLSKYQSNPGETLPPSAARAILGGGAGVSLGEARLMVPLVPLRSKVEEQRLTVGRVPTCDVVLPLPSISRVHAYVFSVSPDSAEFEDAGSKNGTVFQSVMLNAGERVGLEDGGRITFGDVDVQFCSAGRLSQKIMSLALGS